MFRQLNLFLAFLTVMLIISPLAQARGRDGLHHRKETRGKHHQPKRTKGRQHLELTAEQRDAIKSKVTELKAAEAKPEEIRQSVGQMLPGFGIDPAQGKGKRAGQGRKAFDQLTEEQKSQIDGKVKELRQAGATRQEIREQVNGMLEGFGLEVPKKKRGGKRGFRGKGKRRYTTPGQVKRDKLK